MLFLHTVYVSSSLLRDWFLASYFVWVVPVGQCPEYIGMISKNKQDSTSTGGHTSSPHNASKTRFESATLVNLCDYEIYLWTSHPVQIISTYVTDFTLRLKFLLEITAVFRERPNFSQPVIKLSNRRKWLCAAFRNLK